MSARRFLLGVFGASILAAGPAGAADLKLPVKAALAPAPLPAVDGTNWKFGGLGGSLADRTLAAGTGSVSIPLGGQYGMQFDGALGSYDSRFLGAAGAHLFWRDPTRGLVGLYGSYTHWSKYGGVDAGQVAAEGEIYFGRFTIQGIAGVEFGNSTSGVAGNLIETFDVKTRFFDKINFAYYFTDDLKGFVGHRYVGGRNALALGGEAAFRINGPMMGSLFVEGRIGEGDYHGVWGGLRVYLGRSDKTLIRRNREDDPLEWTPETIFTVGNSLTTTPVPTVTPPPPPPPPPPPSEPEG